MEEQTTNIFSTIDGILKDAGTDKTKLLTASIWLKNVDEDFPKFNTLWQDWIDINQKPVRALVEANLAFPHLLVEVQVTAAVDEE